MPRKAERKPKLTSVERFEEEARLQLDVARHLADRPAVQAEMKQTAVALLHAVEFPFSNALILANALSHADGDFLAKDIPEEVLRKFSEILGAVADSKHAEFYAAVRSNVGYARVCAKRIERSLAASDADVNGAAEKLLTALSGLPKDRKAAIEEVYRNLEGEFLIASNTFDRTTRPLKLGDVINVIQLLASITSGTLRARGPGHPHGFMSGLDDIYQQFVGRLLRDVHAAGCPKVRLKKLIAAIDLLGPFMPGIIPPTQPVRTIERVKAAQKERVKSAKNLKIERRSDGF